MVFKWCEHITSVNLEKIHELNYFKRYKLNVASRRQVRGPGSQISDGVHRNSYRWVPVTFLPVLGIRIRNWIRIRMFLGHSDPDPLVRGADPDPFSHKLFSGLK